MTETERTERGGLARSTTREYRLHQRALIVLLAVIGAASRTIGRTVGCTIGTRSKWQMPYARSFG